MKCARPMIAGGSLSRITQQRPISVRGPHEKLGVWRSQLSVRLIAAHLPYHEPQYSAHAAHPQLYIHAAALGSFRTSAQLPLCPEESGYPDSDRRADHEHVLICVGVWGDTSFGCGILKLLQHPSACACPEHWVNFCGRPRWLLLRRA